MNEADILQLTRLTCGNPKEGIPASFSRFVLPFAYQLQNTAPQPQGLFYQEIPTNEDKYKQRRKYLTNETALVLFERAKWFEIPQATWLRTPWETETIKVTLKTGEFHIKMLPPTLVLFEFPKNPENINKNNLLQTGFLYVDVYFPKEQAAKPTLDDLLLFNDLFRHFDIPHEDHPAGYKNALKNIPIDYPINDSANYLKLADASLSDCYFSRWLNLLKIPLNYEGSNYKLMPDKWMEKAGKWINKAEIQTSSDDAHFLIHVDNRCYVWTAAFLKGVLDGEVDIPDEKKGGGEALNKAFNEPPITPLPEAQHFGHWVKFLNIDLPNNTPIETHQFISEFEKDWAKQRTYNRWQHDGTWYGFNYHSGVMLASASSPAHLCQAFREVYFDQTLLLLCLRTILFHFSRELSLLIHKDTDKLLEDIRRVRNEFSKFAILYQFPSLSNQQQGIEMYTLARKCLDIDELYQEIQTEINNAHDFLEQSESTKLNSAANTLAQWGVPLAAASVVASLFGMNQYDLGSCIFNQECPLWDKLRFEIGATLLALLIGFFAVKWQKNKS
jgi:hypothetical protein